MALAQIVVNGAAQASLIEIPANELRKELFRRPADILEIVEYETGTVFRSHSVEYGEDEFGKFVSIAESMPPGIFVEIDDKTFGTLAAVRIYK